jgi:hypothetical protein
MYRLGTRKAAIQNGDPRRPGLVFVPSGASRH